MFTLNKIFTFNENLNVQQRFLIKLNLIRLM